MADIILYTSYFLSLADKCRYAGVSREHYKVVKKVIDRTINEYYRYVIKYQNDLIPDKKYDRAIMLFLHSSNQVHMIFGLDAQTRKFIHNRCHIFNIATVSVMKKGIQNKTIILTKRTQWNQDYVPETDYVKIFYEEERTRQCHTCFKYYPINTVAYEHLYGYICGNCYDTITDDGLPTME
jgi:hypothetical protein